MPTRPDEGSGRETIDLPEPHLTGGMPLVEALARRRSVREFGVAPLALAELSQLCWAARGVTARSAERYGPRAQLYAELEAGHAAQNLLLQGTALGLGSLPVGAFDPDAVREALALPADHTALLPRLRRQDRGPVVRAA